MKKYIPIALILISLTSCLGSIFKITSKEKDIKRAYGCVYPLNFTFSQLDSLEVFPDINPNKRSENLSYGSHELETLRKENHYTIQRNEFNGAFKNTKIVAGGFVNEKYPILVIGYLNNSERAYFIFDRHYRDIMILLNGGCLGGGINDSKRIKLLDKSESHYEFHEKHIKSRN